MTVTLTEQPYPLRARWARWLLLNYQWPRGRDRLYLTLRALLRLPRRMVIDLDSSLWVHCDLDDYMQRCLFYNDVQESDCQVLKRILRPGDRLVDGGANVGVLSLLGARAVGAQGRVYAFEPVPAIRALLQANLALNRTSNVAVLPAALTDADGEVAIIASTNGNLGASSLYDGTVCERVQAPARTLDSLLADGTVSGCDVLKLDIEGAELMALRGMRRLFATQPPRAVMIEVSESLLAHFSATPTEVLDWFRSYGYQWYRATPGGELERLPDQPVCGHQNLWALQPEVAGI